MNNDDFLDFSIIRCFRFGIYGAIEKSKKQELLLRGIKISCNSVNETTPLLQQKTLFHAGLNATLEYVDIFNHLIDLFIENTLSESNFLWLQDNNTRQSLFIQAIINYIVITPTNNTNGHTHELFISQAVPFRIFSRNFKKPREAVIDFKRFFLLADGDINRKITLIDDIKTKWLSIESRDTIIPWIKKEKDRKKLITWITKREFVDSSLACEWLLVQKSGPILKNFISYFDILMAINPDKATLTAMRLKKSWSQFKTREKNKENVQFNFILPPSIKNLLKDVCDTTGISRNAFVEMAIKNEYKRFQDTTKKGS
ncbi:hypothetical protein [Aeromonas hydrophila]|uniref:hypothetical protein n=1 Tax=Aeromonas hydrophila TaxID=644 RepID=UPI003EC8C405